MSFSLWTPVFVVLGALGGALVGLICAANIAGAIARAVGREGGWVLGVIIVSGGVPVAVAAGAVLGGWSAGAGRSSPIFWIGAIAAGGLVVLAIGLAILLPDNSPKPPAEDSDGCRSLLRTASHERGDRWVVAYERYCPADRGGHTVNVSVLTGDVTVSGPGNVLVMAGREPGTGSPSYLRPRARIVDSSRVEVMYDERVPIISQASSVDGLEVVLQPYPDRTTP